MTAMAGRVERLPDDELHVSSLLVRSRPERAADLALEIRALPGADVPARQGGRLVVTLLTESERGILDVVGAIRALPGVLSAELVFHRIERDQEDSLP